MRCKQCNALKVHGGGGGRRNMKLETQFEFERKWKLKWDLRDQAEIYGARDFSEIRIATSRVEAPTSKRKWNV